MQNYNPPIIFEVILGDAYYNRGFFNVRVRYSELFGVDYSEIKIQLGKDSKKIIHGHINRRDNKNGTPRIFGGRELKQWIQSNFRQGDVFKVEVLSSLSIKLS